MDEVKSGNGLGRREETMPVVIASNEDLQAYCDLMAKDLSKALEKHATLDKNAISPIVFRVPSAEENVYITSEWMEILLKFQEDVYAILEHVLGRGLSADEKKKAEIKVYIRKGSNLYEVVVAFLNFFSSSEAIQEVRQMSVGQILAFTVPFAAAYAFGKTYMYHKKAEVEKYKADINLQMDKNGKDREIELKKLENERLSEIEKAEVQRNVQFLEFQNKALDSISFIADTKFQSEARVARQLQKLPEVNDVAINGLTFSDTELAEIGKRKEREKKEETTIAIKGLFHADDIHYPEEGAVRMINLRGVLDDGSPKTFEKVPVLKDALSPEVYKAINEGKKLHWDFHATMKGDKMDTILISSISIPDETEIHL